MNDAQLKNTDVEIAVKQASPEEDALERYQDLIWELDFCAGYEFAAMVGLAAPLMSLITGDFAVINFYGGSPDQRKKFLQLAISGWTDPEVLDDKLVNLSWDNWWGKLGFSYTFHSEKFSVEKIKKAVTFDGTRMAIMCGERALDEDVFLDESVGGEKVHVLNLDVEQLGIEVDLGIQSEAILSKLSNLSRSYAGEFLLEGLRAWKPRIEDICKCLRIQAGYEYEDDLIRIVRRFRIEQPDAFDRTLALNLSYIPRMLSAIKAVAVIAIEQDVLPNIQHYAVFGEIYWCWGTEKIEAVNAYFGE